MDNLVAACKPCNSSRGAKYRNIKHSQKNTAHPKNETININSDKNKIPFLSETQKPPHEGLKIVETASLRQFPLVRAGSALIGAGSCAPRLETSIQDYAGSYGDQVAEWSAEYLGIPFMDWQRHIAHNLLVHDAAGGLLHRQGLLVCGSSEWKINVG